MWKGEPKGAVEGTQVEYGEWLMDVGGMGQRSGSLVDEAVAIIMDGGTPFDVLRASPKAFFMHKTRCWDLYEAKREMDRAEAKLAMQEDLEVLPSEA